jgi:hypothetical protein
MLLVNTGESRSKKPKYKPQDTATSNPKQGNQKSPGCLGSHSESTSKRGPRKQNTSRKTRQRATQIKNQGNQKASGCLISHTDESNPTQAKNKANTGDANKYKRKVIQSKSIQLKINTRVSDHIRANPIQHSPKTRQIQAMQKRQAGCNPIQAKSIQFNRIQANSTKKNKPIQPNSSAERFVLQA